MISFRDFYKDIQMDTLGNVYLPNNRSKFGIITEFLDFFNCCQSK